MAQLATGGTDRFGLGDRPIRWGIAGTGSIASQMAEALATIPDAELVAVGSRSIERARAFADRFGVDPAHAHGSDADLFADGAVDIVYVASPHSEHARQTVAALRAGRHVLCEKAFAVTALQAREMAAVARAEHRFLMEAMWTWFLPLVIDLRARIEAGAIGQVRAVESSFGLRITGETGRHRELALAGGALLDLGIYPVALTRFLLGPPTEVRAIGQLGPTGVDVNLGAVLGHADGAISVFHTGLDALTTLTATITGTEGTIAVDAPFWCPTAATLRRHDGVVERIEAPHRGLAHEAEHAMACLRAGRTESDVIPLAESVAMLETLDEIRAQIGLVHPT